MQTDQQLKLALAKLLPDQLEIRYKNILCWKGVDDNDTSPLNEVDWVVLDTQLLHVCWLAEKELTSTQLVKHGDLLDEACQNYGFNATWQQRVTALCKVKGIELC